MASLSITVFMIRRLAYAEFFNFLEDLGAGTPTLGGISGTFYSMPDNPSPPGWVLALSDTYVPRGALNNLVSQSPAGILVVRANKKLFAICFGHAWMKLKSDWVDHNFGRRVALNSIEKDDLRQLRSEQVLAKRHRSIERSPKNARLDEFGFESDRDLVFSVEGFSRLPPISGMVRGGAPLRFDVEIDSLPKALHAASRRLGFGYQSRFPDIDNLLPVTSKDVIKDLNVTLDKEITAGNPGGLVGLSPPDSLEVFDQDVYFSYGRWKKEGHARSWALSYPEWIASLNGERASLAAAEKSLIHVVDAGNQARKASIKVKDALSFDLVKNDGHFVIFSGRWYRASPNLDLKVREFLASLRTSRFPPPSWNGRDDEGVYNVNACVGNALIYMDARHIFYGGGHSKFEFCDFLDAENKILYFVKNPNSAAGMSHLYEQARRTSELFFGNNPEYLQKLRMAILAKHPGLDVSWLDVRPRGLDWEICLVSLGRHARDLPMFAKCGLMRAHKDLSRRVRLVSYCVA